FRARDFARPDVPARDAGFYPGARLTTVAASQDSMAADTQLTGEYNYRVQKIYRLADGSLVGGAGYWARCYAGIKWLLEGAEGDPPKIKGASLLILRPDRTLWLVEN